MGRKYSIWNSTIFRIIIVIIVLVLPVSFLTIVFSTITVNQSRKAVSEEIQNRLTMAGDMLRSNLVSCVRQLAYVSLNDSDFTVVASLDQKEKNSNQFYSSYYNVSKRLDNIIAGYDQVDLVYFLFPETNYMVSSGYPGLDHDTYRDALKVLSESNGEKTGFWKMMDIGGNCALVSNASWGKMYYGVILNLEWTLNKLNLPREQSGTWYMFTNQDVSLVTEAGSQWMEDTGLTLEQLESSDRYQVYRYDMESFDLTLIQIVDKEYLGIDIPVPLRVLQYVSVGLALLVVPLLLYYISRVVNRPLNRLIKAINLIEKGNMDYRIPQKHQGREFEQINRSFNSMMDQINKLKIDIYEQELEKKDIKMQYLSQQIQPHFILNALNLLYSYEPEDYQISQKMILCMSKYFRYIVKMNDDFVVLSQEMNHIKNYFEIQEARFKGQLFYSVEYEQSLANALIPPLIVQNFAENAIKYALKMGKQMMLLVIADYCPDDKTKMRIRLADTGEGISEELVRKIDLFKKTGAYQEGLGVGIQNVIERLKYVYGDQSSVRIWKDEIYSGTNVEIILPVYIEGELKEESDENSAG